MTVSLLGRSETERADVAEMESDHLQFDGHNDRAATQAVAAAPAPSISLAASPTVN